MNISIQSWEVKNNWSVSLFSTKDAGANTILQDIARAQENIQKTLAGVSFYQSYSYMHHIYID